ncbi:MotA/TolQ/ExbB proton channel family protein [Mariniphaga anaerophila]|nr:MotA/TolQ/ExbB proton channel family protein [Mariniphaga anaerophila]
MSILASLVETYRTGGPLFMTIVTATGLSMVFFASKSCIAIFAKKNYSGRGINYILMFGSLSFILGLLGQAVGMVEAFAAIQRAGDISPALVAGGLRVSMIAPLYGMFYFIISIPIWMVLREIVKHKS